MGSQAHVLVVGARADDLVPHARPHVEALEHRWSRFRTDSELCRLNRMAGSPVLLSDRTFDLIALAVDAWYQTDGRFDPTVLGALEANGYDRTFDLMVKERTSQASEPPRPAPGCDGIVLDRGLAAVTLPTGIRLDLGGIAKGRAADLVVEDLIAGGAAGACVNLGGDLRAVGEAPISDGWVVGIDDPLAPGSTAWTIALEHGAVVTSARTKRCWSMAGRERHHLIDPVTGSSADTGVAAVSVVSSTAAEGEVLAKTALIAGAVAGAELLRRADVPAVMTMDTGRTTCLGRWTEYVR